MTASAASPDDLSLLHNRTFAELAVGDAASTERVLTRDDVHAFAALAGVTQSPAQPGAARSIWGGALISSLIDSRLPGPGTVHLEQALTFHAPLQVGDRLKITVQVQSMEASTGQVVLACRCVNQNGATVIDGTARVMAPTERIELPRAGLPEIHRDSNGNDGLGRLLAHVAPLAAIPVAVVHPCDAPSLKGALDARNVGLIEPVLVGPKARIDAVAQQEGLDLSGVVIEDAAHSHAAAALAAQLAREGKVEALMKGSLHTDELMAAVVARDAGLRTKRRVSHCFVLQTPHYPRPFIVTDAAINLAPDLMQKADIVQNAIDLAHVIGVSDPKVAILAAVETVMPSMQATLDAAALCKMADRGQISGGTLDGPLAFDNAVSPAAARTKGIVSPVAGQADILMVPDLESGNMLAKQLMYLGQAASAGVVMGAKVPVILTSRADTHEARLASCAIALMLAHRYRLSPP